MMTTSFDGRINQPSNPDKPLTIMELRVLQVTWKAHPEISALIDSAIKRWYATQNTPV